MFRSKHDARTKQRHFGSTNTFQSKLEATMEGLKEDHIYAITRAKPIQLPLLLFLDTLVLLPRNASLSLNISFRHVFNA
jgi:hypothetical protein